eukprot:2969607-Alexandrium_andersonii.AAC.1
MAASAAALERRRGGCGHALCKSVCKAGKGSCGVARLGGGASLELPAGRQPEAEPLALHRSFHAASSPARSWEETGERPPAHGPQGHACRRHPAGHRPSRHR